MQANVGCFEIIWNYIFNVEDFSLVCAGRYNEMIWNYVETVEACKSTCSVSKL